MGSRGGGYYRACAGAGWKGGYQGMSKMVAWSLDLRIWMTSVGFENISSQIEPMLGYQSWTYASNFEYS